MRLNHFWNVPMVRDAIFGRSPVRITSKGNEAAFASDVMIINFFICWVKSQLDERPVRVVFVASRMLNCCINIWHVFVPVVSVFYTAQNNCKSGRSSDNNIPVHFLQAPFGSELECGSSYSTAVSGLAPLTFPRCGAILIAGAEYTLYTAVAIPTASGLFSFLLVFNGWGAPNRKAGGMAVYMYSTPRPPYALNKQKGGNQSHAGVDTMSKSALMSVEFHGATLTLINRDGKAYVAIKPICDAITIQWEAQLKRIKRNPVLNSTMSIMDIVAEDGKLREMTCLPLSMLNGWLFGINANRVKNPIIRQKLIEYQFECYDALNAYWTGKTVQPQADLNDLATAHAAQTLIERARYLVGFWHQYGPVIRMLNSDLANGVYDCFWDADWSSGLLARKLGIPIKSREYFQNYPFHKNSFEQHQYYLVHSKK